jgi:hypothetical protein
VVRRTKKEVSDADYFVVHLRKLADV